MEERMKHKVIDPNLPRKTHFIDTHFLQSASRFGPFPLFSHVEFNLSGLCTRQCIFCPRSNPSVFPSVNAFFPQDLFSSIASQLGNLSYDGLIIFSGFGEPLMHSGLAGFLAQCRQNCPKARLEVITNGDLLNPEGLAELIRAGADSLIVSMYDGPEQVIRFQDMAVQAGIETARLVLRERWHPPQEDFGITLTNRGGMVEIEQAGIKRLIQPLERRCYYPFYHLMIDYDGSVLLCTHEWGKEEILGNLSQEGVMEVWNGPKMREARLRLAARDRSRLPCAVCDVDGALIGEGHFRAWCSYYGVVLEWEKNE